MMVHQLHRMTTVIVIRHDDEPVQEFSERLAICIFSDDFDILDRSVSIFCVKHRFLVKILLELIANIIFGCREGKIAHMKF
jgi:hypothetical protein